MHITFNSIYFGNPPIISLYLFASASPCLSQTLKRPTSHMNFLFRCANVAVPFTFREFHNKKKVEVLSRLYLNRLNSMFVKSISLVCSREFSRLCSHLGSVQTSMTCLFQALRQKKHLFALMAEQEAKVQVY